MSNPREFENPVPLDEIVSRLDRPLAEVCRAITSLEIQRYSVSAGHLYFTENDCGRIREFLDNEAAQ